MLTTTRAIIAPLLVGVYKWHRQAILQNQEMWDYLMELFDGKFTALKAGICLQFVNNLKTFY